MANIRLEFEAIDALGVTFWETSRLLWGDELVVRGDLPKPVITYDFTFIPVYTKIDFFGATEQFSRVVDFNRSFADAAGADEQFSRIVDFSRSFADAAGADDAQSVAVTTPKTDAAGADEQFSRIVDFSRNPASQLLLWGEADVEWDSTAVDWATDAGRVGVDDAQRVTVTTPKVDVVGATEQLGRVVFYSRSFADAAGADEQFSRTTNFSRLFDVAGAADQQFSRVVDFSRSPVDTAGADDQFSRIVDFSRSFADAAGADDAQSVAVTTPKTDAAGADEQFSRIVDFSRNPASVDWAIDTGRVGVQDQLSTQLNDEIFWNSSRVEWDSAGCNW